MDRRKISDEVLIHKEILIISRYVSMIADSMKSTGLVGPFQVLDMDQSEGLARVCGLKKGIRSLREGSDDIDYPSLNGRQ